MIFWRLWMGEGWLISVSFVARSKETSHWERERESVREREGVWLYAWLISKVTRRAATQSNAHHHILMTAMYCVQGRIYTLGCPPQSTSRVPPPSFSSPLYKCLYILYRSSPHPILISHQRPLYESLNTINTGSSAWQHMYYRTWLFIIFQGYVFVFYFRRIKSIRPFSGRCRIVGPYPTLLSTVRISIKTVNHPLAIGLHHSEYI